MTASPHVSDLLDEWIDERLPADDERQVGQHLEECASCRAEAAALRAARDAVAGRGDDVELPAGLEDRIRGLLDAEDAKARPQALPATAAVGAAPASRRRAPAGTARPPLAWALPLAAVLVLAVAAVFWATSAKTSHSEPVAEAFAQFHELTGEGEDWRTATVDGAHELEQRWRAADLGFPVRVIDLSMSGYALAGGRVTRLGDRPAALAIYQGPDGLMTCWMFGGDRGPEEESFRGAIDVHEANGFRFHVFEDQGVTLVAWREGEVLCILSARLSRDAVVELAHDKAMAPPLA